MKPSKPTVAKASAKAPAKAVAHVPVKATPKAPIKAAATGLADPALDHAYQTELARFERGRKDETEGWDEMYEALGRILDHEPPLYLAGGFRSARAFLEDRLPDVDERTARSNIRVATYFTPADERAHTVSKLDLLITYLETVAGGPVAPAKLNLTKTRVEVPTESGVVSKHFPEVGINELRDAVRLAKRDGTTTKAKAPPVVVAVRKALAAHDIPTVGVRLRAGKLDLSGVPTTKLAAVGKALIATKVAQ